MYQSLDQLAGRLLIQCQSSRAEVSAEVAGAHNAGLVLTGATPEPVIEQLRNRGFDGPILCDAGRYSGNHRVSAGRGIRPAWCRRQHDLGLVALTDSGYVANYNWTGLRSILRAAARQASPVIAMLPLAARWFAKSSFLEAMAREINMHGVPIAIAIEHQSDPFGVQYVTRGFLQLLESLTVPVLLLRSDVSALGALCHGAHSAAIGTGSSLRHLYPVSGHRRPRLPGTSAFVKPLLSYHRLQTCEQIVTGTPELSHLWTCDYTTCGGATPEQLKSADDPQTAVLEHSLHAQLQLHAELHHRARARDDLVSTWHEHCSHALHVHSEVAEAVPRWHAPANLHTWYTVTQDPLPHRSRIPRQPTQRATRSTDPQPFT